MNMDKGGDSPRAKDLLSEVTRNRLNVKCPCVFESQSVPKGLIIKGHVSPTVEVNQICRNIKTRKRIAKHRLVFTENIPVFLENAITSLLAADCGKFKGPVNVGIQVTNIQPFFEWQ
jgi:hypothetical protein